MAERDSPQKHANRLPHRSRIGQLPRVDSSGNARTSARARRDRRRTHLWKGRDVAADPRSCSTIRGNGATGRKARANFLEHLGFLSRFGRTGRRLSGNMRPPARAGGGQPGRQLAALSIYCPLAVCPTTFGVNVQASDSIPSTQRSRCASCRRRGLRGRLPAARKSRHARIRSNDH